MADAICDDLLGIPYQTGGRGPDTFDCYGLIRHLLSADGIEIPDYLSPDDQRRVMAIFQSELRLWRPCACRPGAIALFRVPGNFHVGYCLGNGRFIHTWQASGGVCIERLDHWAKRLIGYYEYCG